MVNSEYFVFDKELLFEKMSGNYSANVKKAVLNVIDNSNAGDRYVAINVAAAIIIFGEDYKNSALYKVIRENGENSYLTINDKKLKLKIS